MAGQTIFGGPVSFPSGAPDLNMSGTLAARPEAGKEGRFYFVTDTGSRRWTRDTGTVWQDMSPSWDYLSDLPPTFAPSSHAHAESDLTTTDITTNNASVAKHGFLPKLPGGTGTFLRADGAFAAPTAAVAITEVEIDVGATPVAEAIVSVINAGVSVSSKIIGGIAYKAPTGKDIDELEMDALDIKLEPLAGSLNVHVKGLEGYIAGAFTVWYTFA